MYMHVYMYIHVHACVHVQRRSLLGIIPLGENYGMSFDLWNILACAAVQVQASWIEKLHVNTCMYSVFRRLSTEALCVHVQRRAKLLNDL